MEIKLNKTDFLKRIQKVQAVTERKHTLPILANVVMTAASDGLCTFLATDLEVSIKDVMPVEVIEPGQIAVSAKKLFEILRELPEATVSFKTLENDWVKIECGHSMFQLMGLPAAQFPPLPPFDHIALTSAEPERLSLMLAKTVYAAGTDENRIILNSILYLLEEEYTRIVTTDGHRLALIQWPHDEPRNEAPLKVIISLKAVKELRRMLTEGTGAFRFGWDTANLVFMRGDQYVETMIAKITEGDYPDYNMVIPSSFKYHARVPRDATMALLRRVALMADERSRGVSLIFRPGMLEVKAQSVEMGQARDEIQVEYEDEQIKIGFNYVYLMDALKVIDTDYAWLMFSDGGRPVMITTDGDLPYLYKAIVMPMTLKD